jgi:hypothetical protein
MPNLSAYQARARFEKIAAYALLPIRSIRLRSLQLLAFLRPSTRLPQCAGMSSEQQRSRRSGIGRRSHVKSACSQRAFRAPRTIDSMDLLGLTQLASRSRHVLALLSTLCLFAVG